MTALTAGTFTDSSVTVSGSSSSVLAADSNRNSIILHNPSASANVAVAVGGTAAVLNGLGALMLGPFGTVLLDTAVATNALNAISDTPGSPLTIFVLG